MTTFIMLGKYSSDAMHDVNIDRTEKALRLIDELGGKVLSMYALLGNYDCVFVIELPDEKIAMKASLGLSVLTGISFTTYPAVAIEDFDKILGG